MEGYDPFLNATAPIRYTKTTNFVKEEEQIVIEGEQFIDKNFPPNNESLGPSIYFNYIFYYVIFKKVWAEMAGYGKKLLKLLEDNQHFMVNNILI